MVEKEASGIIRKSPLWAGRAVSRINKGDSYEMEPSYINNAYTLHLDHYRVSLFGENDNRRLWSKQTKDIILLLKDEFQGCMSTPVRLQEGRYLNMERLKHGSMLIDVAHSVRDLFSEWYITNSGWIRITNENKLDYRQHHETIQRVEKVLSEYDFPETWGTQYAELCIDSTDPKKGKDMLLRGYPRNWRGDRPEIITEGLEQYFGTNDRRKRHHSYVKEGEIYRWEIKVGRDTLNRENMNSYSQIIDKAPDLLNKSLCWMEPKLGLSRHYSRMPVGQAVDALKKKTTLETDQVIGKYFNRQAFPVYDVIN